jgi:hypothetical protein
MLRLLSIVETKPDCAASEHNCRMTISKNAVRQQKRLGFKHLDHRNVGKLQDPNSRRSTIKQENMQKCCIEKDRRNLHCALKGVKIEIQISLDTEGKNDSWEN